MGEMDFAAQFPLLHGIESPTDLHGLTPKQLQEVANEIRRAIVELVSQTGGHFSSNLGTVELTVALYATHSIPPDKVVWDTGHQAYPHKLLTGRLERFPTLRKYQGMSGFLKREEHELDVFGAGHAGTAVSAAMGFALARDRVGGDERVVAIAGDASIATGMSWEALNHAGDLGTTMTVVLNDNRMSIAPNVGALNSYLARLRARPWLQDLAKRAKGVVEKFPDPISRVAAGLRHGITHYMAPEETGTIFEEIGWEYIGPVDGHDLPALLDLFTSVRELSGPVFVHAITVKGKGYEVAEVDARKWHGVTPFDHQACELVKSAGPVTYTQAFGAAMCECADIDPAVVAITAAMPDGTGLNEFAQTYPERYFDTGIAEPHAVTMAAGMAAGGLKPFCAIYSSFLQRAYDQVLHDVALQRLPVRFFLDRAGLVGDDGPTHHGAFDLSYLTHIPHLVVMAPRDTTELREMARFTLSMNDGPVAVRYPRGSSDDRLPESRTPIQFGCAEVLRQGRDVTLVAVGSMVGEAFEAARQLAELGVDASVINARFVKPIDFETIEADVRRTGRLVTIEENVRTGGFGQQVRDGLEERGVDVPTKIVALPDAFIEHGAQPLIRRDCGLDAAGIVAAVQSAVTR
ncbi:MAG: 1-deoxy-D-xylulose-5-phosphate synthase [Methanoregulaceae archaeon]|nr:1-deoxy-D-xylulose-5-phosphate synthase [Methanoregulaceae archaeon]